MQCHGTQELGDLDIVDLLLGYVYATGLAIASTHSVCTSFQGATCPVLDNVEMCTARYLIEKPKHVVGRMVI